MRLTTAGNQLSLVASRRICVAWLAVLFMAPLGLPAEEAGRPPNIVVLLADDLGYGELGCQGNPQIPTPRIDSIAARGVRFSSGYVTAAYCSASRAGFLTGKYQARFGYDDNPTGARNENPNAGLPVRQTTLADRLRSRGYATGLVGKWHLGGTARFHPNRRGFDEFFGFTHEGHFFVPPPYHGVTTMLRRKVLPGLGTGRWTSPDGRLILGTHLNSDEPAYDANNPILRQSQPVNELEYLTDAFTREAVDFIRRHRSRPFFLYVAYNAVHSPMQAADAYLNKFSKIEDIQRRIFAGMLANLDASVGTVLEELHQQGIWENTLVLFFSDNGGPTRELTSSNLPLRGGKGQLYEGGIRVPMLCQWPGRIPAGQTFERAVSSLDLHATSLRAAGHDVSDLDGVDLMPHLLGERAESPHPELFWRMGQRAALRRGRWKAVRQARSQAGPWELFDLEADLAESQDLATTHPARLKRLVERWHQINQDEMAAPIRW